MKISRKLLITSVISVFTVAATLTAGSIARGELAYGNTHYGKQALCSGQFPNGTYSGEFEVSADGELSYYTEYLEVDNGEIRVYPTFNSQTREISLDIDTDNVRVTCYK